MMSDGQVPTREAAGDAPDGIDPAGVTAWFAAHAAVVEPPLQFEHIPGGHSNLSYRVADQAGRQWVLQRPPLGHVLASAHDMGRQHRVMAALADTPVPVPTTVGLCDDPAVTGAQFYATEYVDGAVLRGRAAGEPLPRDVRRRAGDDIADVLAVIHQVDPDAVGLGDLGRKESYIARQLSRWQRQYTSSKTRELPIVDAVHDALAADIPEQGPATIVHGDYRLDNCIVGPDGAIRAVLDWELCTLGDPLADLGTLMVYWSEPADEFVALGDNVTVLDGFPDRAAVAAQYAAASGRDVSQLGYYVAFAYWRLACILEGVFARYQAGVMGDATGAELFGAQVEALARAAQQALETAS
jgi:aminoglycoside phosphotransferase (APT) family kinase protein